MKKLSLKIHSDYLNAYLRNAKNATKSNANTEQCKLMPYHRLLKLKEVKPVPK